MILTASLSFYGFWRIEFIPVMLLSVVVDYVVALRIPGATAHRKKRLLLLSLVVNIGLLFYFKYLLFFVDNAIGFANLLGLELDSIVLNIILPLGISFYTFQTISYTVDVYRGHTQPERDFTVYASYVTFFPQLIAGPVLRSSEVISQLSRRAIFSWVDIGTGLRRILYGLFLKVVLADNIAPLVDTGFSMPVTSMSALDVWTLAFLFGFQIFFDFSAYSHIALGSARLMGIQFPENFNFPYLACSPKEFWQRWHISLSSWVRDYLYLPLAGLVKVGQSQGGLGEQTENKKKNKALFISWGIMGFWHGANWTFVMWGLYHSVVIYLYRLLVPTNSLVRKFPERMRYIGGIAVTLPIMMLAWIPFRAESLSAAFAMWSKVLDPFAYFTLGMRENAYLITALLLLGMMSLFWLKNSLWPRLQYRALVLMGETCAFAFIVPAVIIFLRPINQFIYFQF